MKIITFYADCVLPEYAQKNQEGFDWRGAIQLLKKSAARFGYETLVVTDEQTPMANAWLRVGDAKAQGLMMWLLHAQAATIYKSEFTKTVMVSPDTLIAKPLDFLFGKWDLCLLTRAKPKPIVNSVIAFQQSDALKEAWKRIVQRAEDLPPESKEWGADIDAVVDVLKIIPKEHANRVMGDLRIKLLPIDGRFQSIRAMAPTVPLPAPIWDFKGARKAFMPQYAALLK